MGKSGSSHTNRREQPSVGTLGESPLVRTEKRLVAVERQLERQVKRLTGINRFTLEVAGAVRPAKIARAAAEVLFESFMLDFVLVFVPGFGAEPMLRLVRVPGHGLDRMSPSAVPEWFTQFRPGVPVMWLGSPVTPAVLAEVEQVLAEVAPDEAEACSVPEEAVIVLLPIGPAQDTSCSGAIVAGTFGRVAEGAAALPNTDDDVFLGLMARHFSAALERAGLYHDLEERVTERTAALAVAQSALNSEVAERQTAESRLRMAERLEAVGRLALGVGHEINNPLSYIWFNIEFVRDLLMGLRGTLGDKQVDELIAPLDEALGGASRIKRIVEDLRIFGRDDKPRDEAVDVHEVLRLAGKLAMAEIRPRARVVESFEARARVRADRGRLEQVFVNLLVNAAQAMPEGHASENQIRIETRDMDGRVLVEVADTGPGIPPENLPRVFDPFFTTKPVGMGSGLGLSLCHGIVTGMGGTITIESELGRGTRVRVELPAIPGDEVRDPQQSDSELRAIVPPLRASKTRILLVDDEPLIRRSLARLLQEFDVTTAASGRQAIDLLANQSFDVIVCDLMMGDLTGVDVYHALAKTAPALQDRIVFITGGAFTETTRSFLQQIRNPTLKKPVSRKDLHQAIAMMLG